MIIVFYDRNCKICRNIKFALSLIDSERELIFNPIQNDQIYIDFPQLNFWDCRRTIHIINQKNQVRAGEDAVEEILNVINIINKARPLYQSTLGKIGLRLSYKYLNEYRLKKVSDCDECRT